MKFMIFDPSMPGNGYEVRELHVPAVLSPDVAAAKDERQRRLQELIEDGERLRRLVTDPVARAGLRRILPAP